MKTIKGSTNPKAEEKTFYELSDFIYHFEVVAYLNLGDSYWELGDPSNAKKTYSKYLSLMTSQKKDLKRIPQRVYERLNN